MHSYAAGGLSSSSTFAELISVDGYEERQVTEANTSLTGSRASDLSPVSSTAAAAMLTHIFTHTFFTTDICTAATATDKTVRLCVKIFFKQNAHAAEQKDNLPVQQ